MPQAKSRRGGEQEAWRWYARSYTNDRSIQVIEAPKVVEEERAKRVGPKAPFGFSRVLVPADGLPDVLLFEVDP